MLRYLFILLSFFFISQSVIAQKADTAFFYKRNSGKTVSTKDSAEYLLVIIKSDSAKHYTINEYYLNGKRKLVEQALKDNPISSGIMIDGPSVAYFPNGHIKSITNYKAGNLSGDVFLYYPNGKLYANEKCAYTNVVYLVYCSDSTGKVLSENGKGDWVVYNDSFDKIIMEGPVEGGLKNGKWRGTLGDTAQYVISYKKGIAGPGTGYDAANKAYPFNYSNMQPFFKGPGTYVNFLQKNIHYPGVDRENNVQGRVIVQFIIEKNGKATNFNVLRAPDKTLGDEAIRVISLMLWNPSVQYGMPVRSYFTLPIAFSLGNNSQ